MDKPMSDEKLLSALALAQDALSQTLTHAEMPDTLRQQVTLAYEATTDALRGAR